MTKRVFAALFGLMYGAWPAPALGAELEPAAETAAARVVEVTVVGTNEELERIRAAIAPGDLRADDVRWSRADRFDRDALLAREPNAPVVRAFVVLSPRRAELFFADRAAERFLVRELTLANGLDSVGSDAVSQVLALSLAALADNAESGLTRAQTEKLLAPEPPPPAPSAAVVAVNEVKPLARPEVRSFVGATAFYAARVFGGGAPLEHGPGIRIGWIQETPVVEGELWISAQYEFPLYYQTETVGVDWTTAVLRGGFSMLFLPKPDSVARFGVVLGAGADLLNFTPRAGTAPADLALASPGQTSVFALSLRIVASVRLGSHLDASAELFSDVYPTRVSYALSSEDQTVNVLTPWRIRPGLALALTLR